MDNYVALNRVMVMVYTTPNDFYLIKRVPFISVEYDFETFLHYLSIYIDKKLV